MSENQGPSPRRRKLRKLELDKNAEFTSGLLENSNVHWSAIFLNPLIMDNLLEYLTINEMKALRGASTQINDFIISCKSSRSFVDKSVFVISPRNSSMDVLKVGRDVKWKNIKVFLDGKPPPELRRGKRLSPEEQNYGFPHESMQLCRKVDKVVEFPRLGKCPWILQHPCNENVTDLSLDFFCLASISSLFKNIPKTLKKIEIRDLYGALFNIEAIEDNFTYLADHFKSLESISLGDFLGYIIEHIMPCALLSLLKSNCDTLTNLNLPRAMERLQTIQMPLLKHLKTSCETSQVYYTNNFLANQTLCQLESLSITLKETVPQNSVTILLQTISKWKKSLKQFHFVSKTLDSSDWAFLSQFEVLQNFSFANLESNDDDSHEMDSFPKSLKSLFLQGINLKSNIFTLFPDSLTQSISELTLLECRPIITDSEMQIICSAMTNLKKLEITNSTLTNYGITGVPPLQSLLSIGIPISNLRKLQSLKFQFCPEITEEIQEFFKFESLETLNLEGNAGLVVNREFVVSLMQHNPRLEKVYLSKETVEGYQNALRKTKLKKLTSLRTIARNMRICSLIFN